MASARHIRLRRAEPRPYSAKELAKHIDPILLKGLGWLTLLDTIEQKRLTVIFWDISGFSAMCDDFDRDRCGEAIVFFLNEYFKMAIKIIKTHHGVLDKFMGDGILAYFGYNRTKNGDPFNAVSAALEFKKQFPMFKKFFAEFCKNTYGKNVTLPYDLKCGINNGPAYVHYFNTPVRNSVIFLGSTLNFASRLEDLAEEDEIIVSKELKNMVEGKYKFRKILVEDRRKDKIKSYEKIDVVYALKGSLSIV